MSPRCTLHPSDQLALEGPLSRVKSLKKSLRQSFRRMRRSRVSSRKRRPAGPPGEVRPKATLEPRPSPGRSSTRPCDSPSLGLLGYTPRLLIEATQVHTPLTVTDSMSCCFCASASPSTKDCNAYLGGESPAKISVLLLFCPFPYNVLGGQASSPQGTSHLDKVPLDTAVASLPGRIGIERCPWGGETDLTPRTAPLTTDAGSKHQA